MTTTWDQFLTSFRNELGDTGTKPRWSDDMLLAFTVDAVREYSMHLPRRIDRVELTIDNGAFALPSDYVREIYCESPVDTFIKRREAVPGRSYPGSSGDVRYYVDGGKIYVQGSDVETVYLTYYAIHAEPYSGLNEDEEPFTFTVPDSDIELVRLYCTYLAHRALRARTARLDRFEPGSGARDDNPLLPETNSLLREFYDRINYRISGTPVKLWVA